MKKFEDLPQMPAPKLPAVVAAGLREELAGGKPLCGGCGSKVGGADLAAVLSALPSAQREDVLSAPGDDAAVLAFGTGQQVLTTDHLRAFTEDPYRMARIAAVHALGDIWAMGAAPQAALASVILPRMTPHMQAETLREIMQGATEIFRAAGADVVGGHTSLGSELTIGFTVTGLTDRSAIRNSGARPGDILILTKPIGTGTILAAEMQGKAKGAWVAACYAAMEQPLGRVSAVLTPFAHAMTDVTGFGLAGHLDAMMAASGTSARLVLADIPLLDGAEPLAADGIRSTIWPANRAALGWMP
ncbi:MAG TPA: selenide, water dikinase SelD, partial [Paracoccaceae bacterium]|nr:selenide, water dikinase SelD [Paracoccaceae bacterium]